MEKNIKKNPVKSLFLHLWLLNPDGFFWGKFGSLKQVIFHPICQM
jgi:hypothetical protein